MHLIFFTTFRMRYTFCKHFYRRIHIFYKKKNKNNKTTKKKNQNETKQNKTKTKTKTNKQKISNNNKQKDKITVFICPSMSCQSIVETSMVVNC